MGRRLGRRGAAARRRAVSATAVTASRALGYRQVLDFIDGEITEEEALYATVRATRRFARRQDSWFRRDPRIPWLRYDRPDLVHAARGPAARLRGVPD